MTFSDQDARLVWESLCSAAPPIGAVLKRKFTEETWMVVGYAIDMDSVGQTVLVQKDGAVAPRPWWSVSLAGLRREFEPTGEVR